MAEQKDKSIDELGESGLINHLTGNAKLNNSSSIKGIGDDAAVIEKNEKEYLLITSELFTEGVDFNLIYFPLKHLGYKIVVAGISDIYAMNGSAKQISIDLAFSSKFTLKALEDLYEGIHLACDKYQLDLVGGGTTTSMTGMHVSITAVGTVSKEQIVYRHGARKNDLICVSGDVGAAYMGLQLLEREKKVFESNPDEQPQLQGYEYILERQLKPEARKDIITFIDQSVINITSMIDLSDGIAPDLLQLCHHSNTGCLIYKDKLPIHPNTIKFAGEIHYEPLIAALNGGDDYELLFTIPLSHYESMNNIPEISIIGHMAEREEGHFIVTEDGNKIELKT